MSFKRDFGVAQTEKMTEGKNAGLFELLKADVLRGEVFPAVRKNELHFYYKGGCLYRFAGGSFRRNPDYGKFGIGCEELSPYERAKREIENKFAAADGKIKERRLLDALNRHTFDRSYTGKVVVLDIEVALGGSAGRVKKCDMVLLDTETDELMFVEGKIFSDGRVNVAVSFTPEVIEQVNTYTAAITQQRDEIIRQYARHVEVINGLFGTGFRPPKKLITPAKLVVFGTPAVLNQNGRYCTQTINAALGSQNVLWVGKDENPSLDEIRNFFAC